MQQLFVPLAQAASKEAALELVHNIQTTFGKSISELDWMDNETKAQATEKLGKISNKIGNDLCSVVRVSTLAHTTPHTTHLSPYTCATL
jgi:predicted metalloendopeptidase